MFVYSYKHVAILICYSDTAYARNPLNNKWYHFDDSYVSETDESHLVVSSYLSVYCVCVSLCLHVFISVCVSASVWCVCQKDSMNVQLYNTRSTRIRITRLCDVLQTSAAYVLFYKRRIDSQSVLLRRVCAYTHRDPPQDEPDKKEVCILTFYYNM